MLRTLILVVCLSFIGISSGTYDCFDWPELDTDWENFKDDHEKNYTDCVEEQSRYNIFRDHLEQIDKHNKKFELGLETFEMGVSEFTDMTDKEFFEAMFSPDQQEFVTDDEEEDFNEEDYDDFTPSRVDWRASGMVSRVKRQGKCGVCWAFAATGVLESQYLMRYRRNISLSEQNFMDCAYSNRKRKCKGGFTKTALDYAKRNGVEFESVYPFVGDRSQCHLKRGVQKVKPTRVRVLPKNNEYVLQQTVANSGPVAISQYRVLPSFRHYRSGVLYTQHCNTRSRHAMIVVGYGRERNLDYWLIKNSWGPRWGDHGFVKVARNKGNYCGVATFPVIPQL